MPVLEHHHELSYQADAVVGQCFSSLFHLPAIKYNSLSQSFYPGGTLEIIFRSQGTPA
jgi:hypothetical protein